MPHATATRMSHTPYLVSYWPPWSRNSYSKACLRNVSRKCSKIWLLRANIKSYFMPKVYPILKLSNYKPTTSFLGDISWLFAHVFYEFLPSRWRFFVFVLRRKKWISYDPNIAKIQKACIWRKKTKNKKKHSVTGWQGVHRTRVPNFSVYFQKNGVDIGCLTNFGTICLSQPIDHNRSEIYLPWKINMKLTNSLTNPRPTQPKKNEVQSGIWATFSHSN